MIATLQDPEQPLPVLVRFAIIMGICLLVPPICRRVHLPACVGLLMAGVAVGPHGFQVFPEGGPVASFLAEIGKLLLMFFAGSEIDLSQFKRTGRRSMIFGVLTFSIPMFIGAWVGWLAGYQLVASLLIGSIMASHTLLGFPIVQRMKLVTDEAVAVTIGGTVFTDLASLLVLAICLPVYTTGFSVTTFLIQIVELAIYIPLVLFGLSALGKWLLARMGNAKEQQVTLLFVIIAMAGLGAEGINLEPIIGAFLAGLAVNRALSQSEAKEEMEFLGNTLFIPIFFVSIGFLVDMRVFVQTMISKPALVFGIVGGLIVSKFVAAWVTRGIYAYSSRQRNIIWSLSLPQVAATLAAAIVAYQTKNAAGVRLLDESMINAVLVLVVVTSVLGPVLTEVFGRQCLEGRTGPAGVIGHPPQPAT
jgi:Kef-type K+ transport system membrane component KefB